MARVLFTTILHSKLFFKFLNRLRSCSKPGFVCCKESDTFLNSQTPTGQPKLGSYSCPGDFSGENPLKNLP